MENKLKGEKPKKATRPDPKKKNGDLEVGSN